MRLENTIPHNEIRTQNDANIVQFQSLAGMDTSNLCDRFRFEDPKIAISLQIPFRSEVSYRNLNVHETWGFLANPVPAIACHHSAPVVDFVSLQNEIAQRVW